jgi:hypothetical protein
MTEVEELKLAIDTLKEAIELNRMNLHQRTQAELRGILENTADCKVELERLEVELERLTNSN